MFKEGWSLTSLIIIATILFLWLIKAPLLSLYISESTGLSTSAKMASLWPEVATIRYFKIDNPKGYAGHNAFSAKKIVIRYSLHDLFATPTAIDEITIQDVDLYIFIKNRNGDNNWSEIGSKLFKHKGKKGVVLHKLVLKNMTVYVQGKGAEELGLSGNQHFDQMEFSTINSQEGFPTKELVTEIFKQAGLMKYIENFLNPTESIKDDLDPLSIL